MTNLEIVNKSNNPLPKYATIQSAGMDLCAFIPEDIELKPLGRALISTGIYIALEEGTEAQIRPRSGMAYKEGITVLNSPGTIDADYRGEVKVLLVNLSSVEATIQNGDRIAQMVIASHRVANFKEVESLSKTLRGEGGFGSTGKKN